MLKIVQWFHDELNPKVYTDFRDSTWSSVLLTSFPTPLSFSSSHCFSYTNFLATLQIHQAAAHSHLRVFALAHVPGIFSLPNPAICMAHSIPFRSLHKLSPLSESSSLINPHSSLSFLFPYAALHLSIALITTCHIFIGLFVYCLSPQAGL